MGVAGGCDHGGSVEGGALAARREWVVPRRRAKEGRFATAQGAGKAPLLDCISRVHVYLFLHASRL